MRGVKSQMWSPTKRKVKLKGCARTEKKQSPARETHMFLKLPAKGERKPTQSRAAFLFGIEGRAEGERCIETIAGAETYGPRGRGEPDGLVPARPPSARRPTKAAPPGPRGGLRPGDGGT